jgi:hypothetical protein
VKSTADADLVTAEVRVRTGRTVRDGWLRGVLGSGAVREATLDDVIAWAKAWQGKDRANSYTDHETSLRDLYVAVLSVHVPPLCGALSLKVIALPGVHVEMTEYLNHNQVVSHDGWQIGHGQGPALGPDVVEVLKDQP